MKHVALYINEVDKLVCNGKPTYCITNFSLQSESVPVDRTFYLEDEFVNHIVNHYTLDQLDTIFSSFYYHLKSIYCMADTIHNAPNKKDTFLVHSPNTKFGHISKIKPGHTKIVPLPSVNIAHEYEYDVHAAYAAMLMFRYYISDKDEGHEGDGHYLFPTPDGGYRTVVVCENPLKDIHAVSISNGHIFNSENEDTGLYLCSTRAGYYKEYTVLLMTAQELIRDCWRRHTIDCSHLVYAFIISQVMKSMYSKSKRSTIRTFDALLQLSSIKILSENPDQYFGYYSDAVFCEKTYSKTPVPDRTPGHRYYKKVSNFKAPVNHLESPSIRVVQDFHEVDSYGLGWASFDRKHLVGYDLDNYDMYHVDMKSAYPSRYYKKTGRKIDKKSFGKIKCFDSILYQDIRLQVSKDSLEVFKRVGSKNVVYWKTDGGICLINKDVDPHVLLDGICQLHIDKIISSEPLFLPEWINFPEDLRKISRLYAYKVTLEEEGKVVVKYQWANLYEDCIENILNYNDLTLPKDFDASDASDTKDILRER